jgi:hypothetical protein
MVDVGIEDSTVLIKENFPAGRLCDTIPTRPAPGQLVLLS